jgi:hypothetical protein
MDSLLRGRFNRKISLDHITSVELLFLVHASG